MMLLIRASLVLAICVAGSFQDATFNCEIDRSTDFSLMFGSYYGRSSSYRCTFKNVLRVEDLDLAVKSSATAALFATRASAIIFENSSLSQLPERMFSKWPSVKIIDASRLVMDAISANTFSDLKSLDNIDFSKNNIKELSARTFAAMSIKSLDLSMNYIEKIDEKAFVGAMIEKINLSFNSIKSIRFLNSFNYFNYVLLNDNAFESLDKIEVKNDGWSNRSIFSFGIFPNIFLQNNKLKSIDCKSTVRLNSLHLEDNKDLTVLTMNECSVDQIYASNCEALKKVTLNDNLLGFTASNVNLGNIEWEGGKSLTTLSLSNSSLPSKFFDTIVTYENLTTLDVSFNNIGPLNISTFAKLKALEFLNLKATNISNIQFGTFSHQHSVKQFDISDNHLGFFDMNMIFSMNNLLSLDISGNNLTSLENIDSAHFTFTMLHKIDLTKNKWTCNYLMRLIKIFLVYKVELSYSNLEEEGTNIHGISCIHVEGQDDIIEPLMRDSTNLTDVLDKMNELILEVRKNSENRVVLDARLKLLEQKFNDQLSFSEMTAALESVKSQNVEVKNSSLLDLALVIVCICFVAFIAMKMFYFVKQNFIGRPKRAGSERTALSMTIDDDF